MLLFLTMMALAGYPCEREPGRVQCPTVESVRCKGVCFLKDRPDGGVRPINIRTEQPTEDACMRELDRVAANGCQP